MDIGKAFNFAFEDEDKVAKLLIGALITLVPIVRFASLGYTAELVRNVRAGQDRPLPTWDRFGDYFIDGLKIIVGWLIYFIPFLLVICAFGVVSSVISGNVNSSDVESAMSVAAACFLCFLIPLMLIPYSVLPALLVQYAETGQIGPLFKFGELWAFIQQDMSAYLMVVLISIAVILIVAPLGLLACGIGIIFTQWWAYLISGHLTGQLARSNDLSV
jgi:hypothetical protein